MHYNENNDFNKTFKTIDSFEPVFKEYELHLSKGYSKLCFVPCDYRTIESYIETSSNFKDNITNLVDNELQAIYKERLKQSWRNHILYWEVLGIDGTTGKVKGFNAKSYDLIVKNKIGYSDKQQLTGADGLPISVKIVQYKEAKEPN